MKAFTYQIATPEGTFASGVCELLVIPTSKGETGILADHEPLLSDIVPGEIRITRGEQTTHCLVGAGYLELAMNSATLLVDEATAKPS